MVLARPLIHILMTDNFRITSIYTYIACYSRLKIFEKNQNFHIFTNTFNVQEIKNIFFLKKKIHNIGQCIFNVAFRKHVYFIEIQT